MLNAAGANGAPVTGYALEYRAGASGPWTLWPEAIPPDARSVRLTDLAPGTGLRGAGAGEERPWRGPVVGAAQRGDGAGPGGAGVGREAER